MAGGRPGYRKFAFIPDEPNSNHARLPDTELLANEPNEPIESSIADKGCDANGQSGTQAQRTGLQQMHADHGSQPMNVKGQTSDDTRPNLVCITAGSHATMKMEVQNPHPMGSSAPPPTRPASHLPPTLPYRLWVTQRQ